MVLAAGSWSRYLGAQIGVEVPIKTNKHAYVVSDIVPGLKDTERLPNVRYFDESIYLKVCMSLRLRKMNGFMKSTCHGS